MSKNADSTIALSSQSRITKSSGSHYPSVSAMGKKNRSKFTTPSSSSSLPPLPVEKSTPFDYTLYKSRFLPRIPATEASAKKEPIQTVKDLESNRNNQALENHSEERKSGKRKRDDEKQEKQMGKQPLAFEFGYMKIDGKLYHAASTETGPMILTPYNQHVKKQLSIAGPDGKAGTLRAMGIKENNPKALEKRKKKKEKLRKKHAKEWKERVSAVDKTKAERQKKRADNIKAKIQEKKMRKIAKREKKLMYPGSKGSKEGNNN